MSSNYLPTIAAFKARTVMPSGDVDDLESRSAGWLVARAAIISAKLDSRLSKRYAAPFESPFPETVVGWCADMLTRDAYLKRGVNPSDAQWVEIKAAAERADAEVKEAADSVSGLFELPLRNDTTAGGISRGGPRSYSEAGPYSWMTAQAAAAVDEDDQGFGTTRGGS